MATAAQKRAAEKAAADQKAAEELAAAETAAADPAVETADEAPAVEAAVETEPVADEAPAPADEVEDTPDTPAETPDEAGNEPVGLTAEEATALVDAAASAIEDDVAADAAALDEALENLEAEESADEAPVNPEAPQAQAAAIAGVGIASAPLEAPQARIVPNPVEQLSDPNIPEGSSAVIESRLDRPDASRLAAEDGNPIDLDTLWLGPDMTGNFTSTVRLVEHSEIPPYGHKTTQLVVGVGVPVPNTTRLKIDAQLRAQAAASA